MAMSLEKAIQRCFDRCNLYGENVDVIEIMYQYKAFRDLDEKEFDEILDEISTRLGFMESKKEEETMTQYPTVTFEGHEYQTLEQAHYDDYLGSDEYVARAMDNETGEAVYVFWRIKDVEAWQKSEWEDDACDWDEPIRIEAC